MNCLFNFLIFLAVCLNISNVINIKILTNYNKQTQSYKFTTHIAAFLSVVLITEMLEICIQTSYDQNVQLILKSYLPVVYGTPLRHFGFFAPNFKIIWLSNILTMSVLVEGYFRNRSYTLNKISTYLLITVKIVWSINYNCINWKSPSHSNKFL